MLGQGPLAAVVTEWVLGSADLGVTSYAATYMLCDLE